MVLELQTQISTNEQELGFLRSEVATARSDLNEARAELAAEGEVVARYVSICMYVCVYIYIYR